MTHPAQIRRWRLYVVTDARLARGRSHEDIVRAAIDGGADVIQFREKEARGGALYESARAVAAACRDAGVPLIVNDRLDIALAVGADGLHVGRDDMPAAVARRLLGPDRILGVSAATVAEAEAGLAAGADYIGAGPVFDARATKADADPPIGLDGLSEICRRCDVPVIAIGGINAANASEVIAAGACGAAVISAVVAAEDVRSAATELRERLG